MSNDWIQQTEDINDSSRESAPLQIAERMPPTVRKPMIPVSDMEIYLRLGVPDGLETNGSWPYKYVPASTDEARNPDESVIRRESGLYSDND